MIAPVECTAGTEIQLDGYADDFDAHIIGVEFSLDGGEKWALFDTSDSQVGVAVRWNYAFTPTEVGDYELLVRSVTADGRRSPEPARVTIHAR